MFRPGFVVVLGAFALAGCGGDDDAGGGGGQRPNQVAAAKAKADAKNKLNPRKHVEDNVTCPVPDKPTGPQCEPLDAGSGAVKGGKMLADCDPGLYCLPVGASYSCEPCPERESIRHEFKERDFVADQSRDPFFNFVIMPLGVGDNSNDQRPEPHQSCKRRDQFKAGNYSYQDLKLVGIVAQGAQRKVLMLDTAGVGHDIKRGDCVGKEKAVVKDIGTGYVTFVVEEDPDNKRPAQETSVQLHPPSAEEETVPGETTPDTTAPVVAPPASRSAPVQVVPPPKK